MTDQEITLASESLKEALPKIVGNPLAALTVLGFDQSYAAGSLFGAGAALSMGLAALAWKGLLSPLWIIPFFALAVVSRKKRAHRLFVQKAFSIAGASDVRIVVHTTGFIELEQKKLPQDDSGE